MRVLTLRLTTVLVLLMSFSAIFAQAELQQAVNYLYSNAQKFDINPDIQWRTVDLFTDEAGVTHVRLIQTYNDIDLHTQMVSVHIQNGQVIHSTGQFVGKVDKLSSNREEIDATAALQIALQDRSLSTSMSLTPTNISRAANKETSYNLSDIALQEVKSRLLYTNAIANDVRLVWDVDIYEADANHWWSVWVDAQTGAVLRTYDQVIHCDFGTPDPHEHIRRMNELEEMTCEEQEAAIEDGYLSYKAYGEVTAHTHKHDHSTHAHTHTAAPAVAANSYRALPLTVESPNHGAFQLIVNPELDNTTASPNGWHDDGTSTYTITRGNNVHAQEDQNGNNGTGYSTDGGASLCFDYTFDPSLDPATGDNLDAAIVNLFVWNNFMHDIYYNYGFTEACFNFQRDNFGRGGAGGDYVLADAQDGSGVNNANFGTPGDGGNPRMQMFMWDAAATTAFTVNSGGGGIPGGYGAVVAGFGPTSFSVTGDLVIADDGTGAPTEACNALINGAAISGNIALIDRGTCAFVDKVQNAQDAGAIGALVCNNVAGAPITMGGTSGTITIPSVMISQGDCAAIRAQIPTVNVTMSATGGTFQIDGDYDAGIVAHEYGHGISNRMTASSAGCLGNLEQMGEGWSDFWGLVLTVQPSHTADTPRGIGTYATGEPTNGGGIRQFPYTRDMSINPETYGDLVSYSGAGVSPHPVGALWCTMIWDLFWDLVDAHGYDTDLYNGTGGNNIAMNLVTQGCKFQGCNPGFVDGRDGILAADQALYGGANQCIIWEAFARRGLGENADQGSSNDRADGVEDFTVPTGLSGGYTFDKTADITTANCGDVITFTLTTNVAASSACATTAPSNVNITDILPAGLTYVPGSADNGGSESGGTISWPTITSLTTTQTYTYQATVDCSGLTTSASTVIDDDVESGVDAALSTANTTGLSNWVITNTQANSGTSSWYAEELEATPQVAENQYLIIGPFTLSGTSSLSFAHIYDTENDWDGGKVEISTDGGASWADADPSIYGGSFIANSPSTLGFSGLSTTWSTVTIDLTPYENCEVSVRFNFYYDALAVGTANAINDGWYIDDIQLTTGPNSYLINSATIAEGGNSQTALQCIDVQTCTVAPKVFLQGPLMGTLMDLSLNTSGLLPTIEPYTALPGFTHIGGGGEAMTASAVAATGSDRPVDWVFVELRDPGTGATVISTRSALVQADGDVVDVDGLSPVTMFAPPGNYHIAIRHRNHLGVMTATPVVLN